MNRKNVLVVEDDPVLNEQMVTLLEQSGYSAEPCFDGDQALTLALENTYDMILLDILLPSRNGLSVLSLLRSNSQTPVILVTAKGAEEERIRGLSKGADDYIAKPFHPKELLLRIEAILRRAFPNQPSTNKTVYALDALSLDKTTQSLTVHGEKIELTPIQFKLLYTLIQNQGEVVSKAFLYQTVLKKNYGAHDRSLDMHLSRVRRKLNQANWNGERLQAIHGRGYCLS